MDMKVFLAIFSSVLLAELGDKTQLATMLFATHRAHSKWVVFTASAAALVLASAVAVLAGHYVSRCLSPRTLSVMAGIGFILIGLWTILR